MGLFRSNTWSLRHGRRFAHFLAIYLSFLFSCAVSQSVRGAEDSFHDWSLSLPAEALQQPVRVALPAGLNAPSSSCLAVTLEEGRITLERPAILVSGPSETGEYQRLRFVLIPGVFGMPQNLASESWVRLHLDPCHYVASSDERHSGFHFEHTSEATITLYEGESPVLAYNFGPITNPQVPEKDPRRTRACYVHPVWGLNGEILTDDFPRDHYHHHGIFWTWPHVVIAGKEFSLWEDRGALRQRFVRWLCQEKYPLAAVLGVENAWVLDDQTMLTEIVWLTVYARREEERVIDIDLFLRPQVPVTLWGAEGKSYGGLTMRFRPPSEKEAHITVPQGLTQEDLYETRLPWADFTSRFGAAESLSGGTIMVAPRHPDYPPTWLTRHYGPLCVGWPGTQSRTLVPGETIHLPYRLWIHTGQKNAELIANVYKAYTAGFEATFQPQPHQSRAETARSPKSPNHSEELGSSSACSGEMPSSCSAISCAK